MSTTRQTEREKLQQELNRLTAMYNSEMHGRMIPSPRAFKLKEEAINVQEMIAEIDRRDAEKIAFDKAPIDDVLEIIAIPLLADVMNDLVAGVDGLLLRTGARQTIFAEHTAKIRKAAITMVETLAVTEGEQPNLLDVDDALIDAIKKKLISFVKQRLNIKKTKTKTCLADYRKK